MANQHKKSIGGNPVVKNSGLRPILIKYFPFLPYVLISAALGLVLAFVYLRYQHEIYEVKARIVINENNGGKDKGDGKIQLSLDPQANSTQEREIEVIRSTEVMKIVIKNLGLYAEIEKKGYLIKNSLFGTLTPLFVFIKNPDSIGREVVLPLIVSRKNVTIGNRSYDLDRFSKSPYGTVKFVLNSKIATEHDNPLLIHLIPPVKYAERLIARLRITPKSKESNIVDLTLDDEQPERAILIVNEVIHVYDSLALAKQRESSQNVIRFIDQRLQVVANDLNDIEQELQKYKSTMGISSLPMEGQTHFVRIQQINQETELINKQEYILDQLDSYMNERTLTRKNVPAIIDLSNSSLSLLVSQLFQAETELERVGKISGPANPQVMFLKGQIAKLRPAISESIHNLRAGYSTARKVNQEEANKSELLLREIPLKEKKLVDITRRQEVKDAIYTYLLQKREETEVSSVANTYKTQILEAASVKGLFSLVKTQVYLICLLGGIAFAIAIIGLIESLNFRVSSRVDIEKVIDSPIIGELGLLPEKEIGLLVTKDSTTVISEQFRDLRSNLNYLNIDNPRKVILVTSSIMGEGKSMISLNIALGLSLLGKKVLIMELDLRRPKISKKLRISSIPGISNYLIGDNQIKDIIRPVPEIKNLFIASCGTIPPNPTELIISTLMEDLMKRVESEFDYVIIDSPPVGIVTDAKLLAPYASSTLFVIRERVTPLALLTMVAELDRNSILPHMAIVYNGVKSKKFLGYKYGYRYGKGYASDEKV